METRLPQSPLHRLVDLEEKAIASLLLAHDIVTPATHGNVVSEGGHRRGFVQLLVYNPHDLAFYCKFLRSPFLSAVEAGTLDPAAGAVADDPAFGHTHVRSAVRDILVRYDETLIRIARHASRLARADKLLPLNFLGESDKRRQSIDWLSKLCDRGSLREWFDLNLYQLFPLTFADVFAEEVFRGMRPAEPESFTISQITDTIVARRAAAAREHSHPALADYLELSHILDFLLFGAWVDRTVDYRKLLPLFGESWQAGADYLSTCKRTFQRVRLPIWFPHSVLGILIVGWEGPWRKSDRQLVELLGGHTVSVGSELRRLRAEVASRRLQHDPDAIVDATIDLIGCRAGTVVERGQERAFKVTPASDELFNVRHVRSVASKRRRNGAANEGSLEIDLPRRERLEIRYEPLIDCDNAEFVDAHQQKLVWDISAALGQAGQNDPVFDRARLENGMRELRRARGTGESMPIGTAAALVVADLLARWLADNDLAEIPADTEIRLLAKQSHHKREGIAYAVVNRMAEPPVGFWWNCFDEPGPADDLDAAARDEFEERYLLTTDIKQAAYFLREAAERREFVEFFVRQGLWVGTLNSKNQRLSGHSGSVKASGNICWIAIRNVADAGKKRVRGAEAGASELLAAGAEAAALAGGAVGA
jgi:hypothetical protein